MHHPSSSLRNFLYQGGLLVAANFYHVHGLRTTRLLDIVGRPQIRHYAPPDWLNDQTLQQPPAGYSFVWLPLYDTGLDKYGSQPTQLKRVFDFSSMVKVFIKDAFIKIALANPQMDHDTVVQTVFPTIDPEAPTVDPNLMNVYNTLENAKRDYVAYLGRERAALSRERTAFNQEMANLRMSESAKARVTRGFAAEGPPNSRQRQEQVQYLWRLQYPDIMHHITGNTEWKDSDNFENGR